MGAFKSAGGSILRYGGILLNKTECYAKITKLKIDIKKIENDIDKSYIRAGRLTADEFHKGVQSFDMTRSEIRDIVAYIDKCNENIEQKKKEIEEIKKISEAAGQEADN